MLKFLTMIAAAAFLAANAQAQSVGKPEQTQVKLGITLATSTFLPIFVAEKEGYFADEGLKVDILTFKGGSDLVRAMIAKAVDVGAGAPGGVITALQAGQDVKVFYGGFNQVPFEWYASPDIKTVADLKGKVIGITRFGSSTDVLTRMVLASGGVDPKDVKIMQGGGSPERLAAMAAGQVNAGPFAEPYNYMAADQGFNLIAKQSDFMPDYPVQSFFAPGPYIKDNPETLKHVLRAFVRGITYARSHRDESIQILVAKIGLEEKYAGRAYDGMMSGFHEDGRLGSDVGIKAFMDMGVASGEFQKPWPLESYWVDTFKATYNDWKP